MNKQAFLTGLCSCLLTTILWAQQSPDTAFVYANPKPAFAISAGPIVMLDAAHYNFHTLSGRYAPFGNIVRGDGFRVVSNDAPFTMEGLSKGKILVIANAQDSSNVGHWQLPVFSAFTNNEIETVREWVAKGGRLMLIADHMPFAGAAKSLANAFGFEFLDCFALDQRDRAFERFYKGNKSLADNPLTQGIDTVVTFTGSAFRIPSKAKPLLTLRNYTLLSPEVAWQFEEDTPFVSADGYYQGAYMLYGKGKIVVMGEAAMFSAQRVGPNRQAAGLNQVEARQNAAFLLNLMRWLGE